MSVWFGEGVHFVPAEVEGILRVIVPTNFFRERIGARFLIDLQGAIEETTARPWRIDILRHDEFETTDRNSTADDSGSTGASVVAQPDLTEAAVAKPSSPATFTFDNPTRLSYVDPDEPSAPWPAAPKSAMTSHVPGLNAPTAVKVTRRLDNFLVGTSNRLAFTAASEMASSRGGTFNPLVLHGGVGLGKTHLLDGIAHALRSHPAGGRVIHVTAEAFTNAFLDAIRTGQLATFRNRFRSAGALIMDDVQFIASKRATQNEFLHTFDALVDAGIPIVLSCDQHPKRIARLTEELSTRFMAGMVVRVETPDPDVRRLILRSKAAARGLLLPESVVDMVCEQTRGSVRELEGVLNSLIAHSVLSGKRIDLELTRNVLRDGIRMTIRSVSLAEIDAATCNALSIRLEDLRSSGQTAAVSTPRTLAMYLARRHTAASYSEIAQHFGLKNHSSVIAAEKRVKQWLEGKARKRTLGAFHDVNDMLSAIQTSLGV
jgi:chromosomal replication initiator protein